MFGFGKKIEVEVPDGQGGVKKIRVSERKVTKWQAEGRISQVSGCKVHICSVDGDRELIWEIGKPDNDRKIQ